MRISAHNRENLTVHGRAERRRRDENRGGQTDLAAVRRTLATVLVQAACRLICAMLVRQVRLGAVACRGGDLLLVIKPAS